MTRSLVLLLLIMNMGMKILVAQETQLPVLPVIKFNKNSSAINSFHKKQLDSVILIAAAYPTKFLSVLMPFGWENIKLNELIWKRAHHLFDYLKKNQIKNGIIAGPAPDTVNVHTLVIILTDDPPVDAPYPNYKQKIN